MFTNHSKYNPFKTGFKFLKMNDNRMNIQTTTKSDLI